MAAIVARMAVSGNAVPVDLVGEDGQPVTLVEARRRIAAHTQQPLKFVRLLDVAANRLLQDGDAALPGDVAVVVGISVSFSIPFLLPFSFFFWTCSHFVTSCRVFLYY